MANLSAIDDVCVLSVSFGKTVEISIEGATNAPTTKISPKLVPL